MRLFFPFTPFSNPLFQAFLRHFSSNTNLPTLGKIPTKYRPQAIKEAQEVVTDYLHTTSALPFSYAEFISKNSVHSLAELMSKVDFSSIYFRKNFERFLRYNPLHEFGFFYESIGIHYCNINDFLKPNVHFFSDDSTVLNVACTLAGFGFPWNKLGRLYVEEISIFEKNPKFLGSKFNGLLAMGFSTEQAVGICLGFPFLLKGEEVGLKGEFDELLDELKRVLIDYDLGDGLVGNVDLWYEVCRKLRLFYDLGVPKRAVGESISKSSVVFTDYSEKVLAEKVEFFCKLSVVKADVGLLLLSHPEILSIDIENRVVSVSGFLNHFGLSKNELKLLMEKYSYVFGRNKMSNLPHILRAMDLHEWFFHNMKLGKYPLFGDYDLSSPDEGEDANYVQEMENVKCLRHYSYLLCKLKFFHGIGFGEHGFTMKLLKDVHGSGSDLHERFDLLLNEGIEFSKLCKMISYTPKILNQETDSLKRKIDFLRQEVGLSLEFLETFPAYLIYNLEKRIKPRYRFHVWLAKQGWVKKKYTLSGIIAISKKGFLEQLSCIHPTAPQLWLEQCEQTKTSESKKVS
ncbi:transcription termination factor MTEF18, mitochondrial-like [Chenopodium quinoa]|uniref:transcription termination factor MTEF18, mitochondrial-like n=1 Tax=Chenopodium quinoa TaxID=63459 RepID=UPI000B794541|nr:transcription termination factor MTEF18, mitochondrial-like [Chenopodium quinoa]